MLQVQYAASVAHNQKLDASPALSPGCDYFTRSTRGPFIDTGVDIDHLSPMGDRIYVSEDTVGEWARMFGWISPTSAETIIDGTLAARAEVEELREEVHRLRVIEQALLAGGFRIPEPEQIPVTEFPHHKGGGWWLFSDGSTKRCSADEAQVIEDSLSAEVAA